MTKRRERAKAQTKELNKQLINQNETISKTERKRNLNLWKSEVLTDMAKLIFAGVILGGIFEHIDNIILLYIFGIFAFMLCLGGGYGLYKKGLKE